MSKHTPGPWALFLSTDARPHSIPNIHVEVPHHGFIDVSGNKAALQKANAVLIAASPDLLQALQLVAKHIPEIIAAGILSAAETDTIRASIAKAGG